ncbi:MAG: YafY family protein [Chloroflexota bacterium]|nr:YafY family protein [Chloroflexota bacterium]
MQARGQMTAGELAKELEVSERTIYRDINALSIAGVPVYGIPGPEGGYVLVDNYRTYLTGLNEGEVRALSMLSIPAPLVDLGVSQDLRSALLKLSASLPSTHRRNEDKVRQCFLLDSTWWQHHTEQVPHLQVIQQALWENHKLHVVYHPPFATEIKRLVVPYGLVAKAGVWYLVSARNDAINVRRVSNFQDVHLSDETFERPASFDLTVFWENWCVNYEKFLNNFSVTVRVSPDFIPELPRYFGSAIHTRIAQAEPHDEDGWIRLRLNFNSFEAARDSILGYGRGVEVLEPIALRISVFDYAEQIVSLYKH